MKKSIVLILSFMFFHISYAKNIIQISIPKSGTHLLTKCISLLTGKRGGRHFTLNSPDHENFARECQQGKYWVTHTYFNEEFLPYLNNEQSAIFFLYRDPRDQLVSAVYYKLAPKYSEEEAKPFIDDLLLSFIQGNQRTYHFTEGIHGLYQRHLPWLSAPHVCVLRFEDLVGPSGGGNAQVQRITIKRVADHLGLDSSEEQINKVINNLFGGTNTFRKGQIGGWKNHFKEHHRQAFKDVAGQLLIDLGYEKDFNW